MKNLQNFNEFIGESTTSDKLSKEILKSIEKIDDSMSYEDFAKAVAHILIEEYGSHNFQPFLTSLNKELSKSR
jgi:hypothetical protein